MPFAVALMIIALALAAAPAVAQGVRAPVESTGTFITPFPENETYKIQVYGESMAEGLLSGLVDAMGKEARVVVQRKHRPVANLLKGEIADEVKSIETEIERDTPHVAVVMANMIFRFPWRDQFDRRFPPGSEARREEIDRRREAWKVERGQRIDQLVRVFRKKNIAVYWVGLPIMRNSFTNDDAQVVNELLRERASISGGKYVDIYAGFADESGQFTIQGPDIEGKMRNLRDGEGVWFSGAGYRKLAHFVERELKRDLAQARSERAIPLAGSEDEQKRVRPATLVTLQKASATPGAVPKAGQAAADQAGAGSRVALGAKSGISEQPGSGGADVQADNSRITLKSVSLQGREESFTIEILRPSIPSTVYAAITRRESADKASQLGDAVTTELQGGQTVISTVTPFADGSGSDRRRGPGAPNSPFQLVLEKGQTLPSKPGRADDMPWPRIEALPTPVPVPAAVRPASGETKGAPARQPAPKAPAQK